jgi:urease accessory protein
MAAETPHPAFAAVVEETTPQAAPHSPGKDGRLELTFERNDGGTRLVHDLATAPFHVAGTLDTDPISDLASVIVQSPTGGIAQGDRRRVDIEVGPEAYARVGTASSTKVHSMTHNYAQADLFASLAAGSHFEYLPEPTILHEESRLYRSTEIDIDPDATAIIGDVIVPGRLARNEAYRFDRFVSELAVRRGEKLLAADSLWLEPGSKDLDRAGRVGDRPVVGTMYVLAPAVDTAPLSDAIHESVTAATADETVAGATELPNDAGIFVRSIGAVTPGVRSALDAGWATARGELLDEPTPRRRR